MSLNLTIFLIFYLLIIMSTIGFGYFIINITNLSRLNFSYGYLGLFGIFFLIFYSYLSHFFIAHEYINNLFILILGFFFFLYYFNKDDNKKIFIIVVLFFLFIFIAFLIYKPHDDFPYYHFPYTYYLTQNKLLIGVGNFNHGFRTPSSIFYLNSLFYLPIIRYFFFQVGSVMIMGFVSLIFLENIRKHLKIKNYNITFFLTLMSFVFVNIFFYRVGEHGTDRSAQILIFLIIIELLIIINIKKYIKENSAKLLVLLGLIISLKAFYILYISLLLPIFYFYIKDKKLKYIILEFKNYFTYLFILLLLLVLSVNFFNTGCLIYPIGVTCFDQLSWSIPLTEVSLMNDWYEQWSKGGAGPNFRVENPEIYIQSFNWVNNWFKVYFFNKMSDFIFGLIFLIFIFFIFFYTQRITAKKNSKGIIFIYFILILLFMEWFYNHPALRYGGYPLISLLLFLPTSNILGNRNYSKINMQLRVNILILITLSIFFIRNTDRLIDENKQYGYNPLKIINYPVDEGHFRIQKTFSDIIKKNKKCIEEYDNCNKHPANNVKKKAGYIIFFRNK